MKTVKEVSRLTGVSVRALHHYDAIGLLTPSRVTEAGYRLYDDASLRRLHTILLFRELQFPLGEIRKILDTPDFDPAQALQQQIELLILKQKRLEGLIRYARQIQKTGVIDMDFTPFDTTEMDRYAAEAKAKWGATEAYREFAEKTRGRTQEALKTDGEALMDIFAEFGAIKTGSPESQEAQALVGRLQDHITAHFYTCTGEILKGLGQMYAAGDAMTENIDKAGGPGTAQFVHEAIQIYCK